MSTAVSPLAPLHVPDMPVIAGVRMATAAAGIRYAGRTDVLLAFLRRNGRSWGVHAFEMPLGTGRMVSGASEKGEIRGLVVNSGNANAFTGKSGRDACKFTAQIASRAWLSASDSFLHRRV